MQKVLRGVTAEEAAALRSLSCAGESGRFPWVCCELRHNNADTVFPEYDEQDQNDSRYMPPTATTSTTSTTRRPTTAPVTAGGGGSGRGGMLPGKGQCGQDPLGNRIYGGTAAGIREFPWMALLEYKSGGYYFLLFVLLEL